jgi:hypothetical protein
VGTFEVYGKEREGLKHGPTEKQRKEQRESRRKERRKEGRKEREKRREKRRRKRTGLKTRHYNGDGGEEVRRGGGGRGVGDFGEAGAGRLVPN